QNFGIQSSVALNTLTINSTNQPTVHLISTNLELHGDLNIETGAIFNGFDRNLLLHNNVTNDGELNFTTGKISLVHPGPATVSGSGVFNLYDLERTGGSSGQTLVQTNLLVENNFINDEGEMD